MKTEKKPPKVVVIGKPLTSTDKRFQEDKLHDKRFMSFMLIPLAYSDSSISFNYVLEKIVEADSEIPRLKVYPKEPPVISYVFSNTLDDTFLSSLVSSMTGFVGGLRYLIPNFSPSQDDWVKNFHRFISSFSIGGEALGSGIETLAKVLSGYTAMLPKVWTHSEAGTTLRLEIEEQLWVYGGNAPNRFSEIMNALKNFISPRVSKPMQQGTSSVVTETQELGLADFLYSHPYFCRVADGKDPKNVFIPAGMVTNASINIDTKDLRYFFDEKEGTYKGATPNVLKVELEITPLHFSMVADPGNVFAKKKTNNVMTFERLIKSWTP